MAVEPKVIVTLEVERRLNQTIRSRNALVKVWNRIYDLAGSYQKHRPHRHPADPDCFEYPISLYTGGVFRYFLFVVNDTRAPDHLFVDLVICYP